MSLSQLFGVEFCPVFGALGHRRGMQLPENVGTDGVGYGADFPVLWIDRFHPHGVKQHTAFAAKNRAEVDAFHEAAVKAGGTDKGLRDTAQGYPPGYYAAFVVDPDGSTKHRGSLPRRLKSGSPIASSLPLCCRGATERVVGSARNEVGANGTDPVWSEP